VRQRERGRESVCKKVKRERERENECEEKRAVLAKVSALIISAKNF
jgi:hypothetical protein